MIFNCPKCNCRMATPDPPVATAARHDQDARTAARALSALAGMAVLVCAWWFARELSRDADRRDRVEEGRKLLRQNRDATDLILDGGSPILPDR